MFRLKSIAESLGAEIINPCNVTITGVSTDTRTLLPGELFVPLIGEHFDGHAYLAKAKEKGAVAALWGKKELPETTLPLIVVEDTLRAYQALAKVYWEKIHPYTVCITGSNGKTTMKDLIYSLVKNTFPSCCTQGNFNNEIGVPRTILSMPENTQVLVLEMGIEKPGEMKELTAMVTPSMAVFTNVGAVHLENYHNLHEIAQAKMELIDPMDEQGIVILPEEDKALMDAFHEKNFPGKVLSYGENSPNHPYKVLSTAPASFVLSEESYQLPLIGAHQIKNGVTAVLAGKAMGLNQDKIQYGLSHPMLTKMRTDLKDAGDFKVLDDSYKSNPPGLQAALQALRDIPASRYILILGDMLGLGEQSETLHREMGKALYEAGWTHIIGYGNRARYFLEPDFPYKAFFSQEDTERLVRQALAWKIPDCIYFVKGSRSLAMEKLVEALIQESQSIKKG